MQTVFLLIHNKGTIMFFELIKKQMMDRVIQKIEGKGFTFLLTFP